MARSTSESEENNGINSSRKENLYNPIKLENLESVFQSTYKFIFTPISYLFGKLNKGRECSSDLFGNEILWFVLFSNDWRGNDMTMC